MVALRPFHQLERAGGSQRLLSVGVLAGQSSGYHQTAPAPGIVHEFRAVELRGASKAQLLQVVMAAQAAFKAGLDTSSSEFTDRLRWEASFHGALPIGRAWGMSDAWLFIAVLSATYYFTGMQGMNVVVTQWAICCR